MSRTYTISPEPFLVVIKDEEGNQYSCNHMDMIELDGYSVHVPGIYDWYLYFNTYAEWTKHCMDKRFKAKMFHRKGKELAKLLRAQMHLEDILFYYRSQDDDSGVVMKRSRSHSHSITNDTYQYFSRNVGFLGWCDIREDKTGGSRKIVATIYE